MTQKSELGNYGEDIACEYLVQNSYKIIERNHRKPWGEIDIIAHTPDGVISFVEVKTLREYSGQAMRQPNRQTHDESGNDMGDRLMPEDQMSSAKMRKFKRAIEAYVSSHEKLIGSKGYRCDLLALTISEKDYIIKYYKNI